PDEARLLQETLNEEGRADRRLSEMADAHVNDDARLEADMHGRPGRALQYVAARHVRSQSVSTDALTIAPDGGERLGIFDGLLVDLHTSRPCYVVVDGGGLFAHRRYLLPSGDVKLDVEGRTLHVHMDKKMAERYPPFDRESFETMTEEAERAYVARLADLFPRE